MSFNIRNGIANDGPNSWRHRKELPMVDGQPFAAGGAVYVIGGREDLFISRSDDGTTWSDLIPLKTGRKWYSFPGPPIRTNGRIYLEKECRTVPVKLDALSGSAQAGMRGELYRPPSAKMTVGVV